MRALCSAWNLDDTLLRWLKSRWGALCWHNASN